MTLLHKGHDVTFVAFGDRPMTPRDRLMSIIGDIACAFGTSLEDVMDTSRRDLSNVRFAIFHVLAERHGLSQPRIWSLFNMDHTSVGYGIRKVRETLPKVLKSNTKKQCLNGHLTKTPASHSQFAAEHFS